MSKMNIKIKYNKKYINIAVASNDCKKYSCLSPDIIIEGGNSYCCGFRNRRGCPDNPKERSKASHERKENQRL